ncbi:MAG TPA: Ig-like domain-containing protein [Candidatus Limnocylindrales bacterium]
MRHLLASVLAFPARGLQRLNSGSRWSGFVQPALVIGAIAMVVAGLLVGLPAKSVTAQSHDTIVPLAPQANAAGQASDLPLDVAFEIRFTKPMNASTVAAALKVTPATEVKFLWDATGQVLSLAPNPHWDPYTQYKVDISADATDQEGLNLAQAIHTSFQSGSPTAGEITATRMVGDLAAPTTAFKLTFTRPVKLSTVLLRLSISPQIDASILGDDPTDAASRVFTLTPRKALGAGRTYQVNMSDGGTDSSGSDLRPVPLFKVTTLANPAAKFTPQGGAVTYDTNQPISIQFSEAMDQKSTAAAFSVQANGRNVPGSIHWTDDGLTLVFNANRSYYVGSSVTVTIAVSARSAAGMPMAAAASSSFVVSTPRARYYASTGGTYIPYGTGGVTAASAKWHSAELYYLSLMNCTRTGGWVTSSGTCSTQTHHTLPAKGALAFSDGIADNVSRPYAKAMADRVVLTHTLDGTTTHSRLTAGGYPGASWGENIASPSSVGQSGMISIEIFFQNEAWCRCNHYANIMNSHFGHVGVGVWVSNSVRVVADFYS